MVKVTSISSVTGFPEIMDGRVKTLHPAVHGGILARRGRPDDIATLSDHGITPIDIVVVNLYPFVKTASKADIAFDALIEEIDIGGPSMVRSAAKNFQDVLIVVDPADYQHVLAELERSGGPCAICDRPGTQGFGTQRRTMRHCRDDYDFQRAPGSWGQGPSVHRTLIDGAAQAERAR